MAKLTQAKIDAAADKLRNCDLVLDSLEQMGRSDSTDQAVLDKIDTAVDEANQARCAVMKTMIGLSDDEAKGLDIKRRK